MANGNGAQSLNKMLAWAQVVLAVMTTAAFIMIIIALIFLRTNIADREVPFLTGLLSVLGTIFTLQMNYFYARHRPNDNGNGGDAPSPVAPPVEPPMSTIIKQPPT